MSIQTSNLVRFTPGPHNPGDSTPVERFTLNLSVRLDGVTTITTSGLGLQALLTIAFAPQGLCPRARFLGISPDGHAPLELVDAGYWGSSCGYSDPAVDVFHVYSDSEIKIEDEYDQAYNELTEAIQQADLGAQQAYALGVVAHNAGAYELALQHFAESERLYAEKARLEGERDGLTRKEYHNPLLVIGFPCANLFNLFTWPGAVVEYDPPLDEDETPPTITLELAGLKNLNPPTTADEKEIGVQLPMRLILKRAGVTGETALKELIYEDAPGFTGSGTSVTCKLPDSIDPKPPDDAIWAVTGRELAAAASPDALTQTIDYELWWRIYSGAGDMLYRAKCRESSGAAGDTGSQIGEEYRDRRNAGIGGGIGTFLTTDLKVAQVRIGPEPLPFLVTHAGQKTGVGDDGATRQASELLAGSGLWVGPDSNQNPVAVSWEGSSIYIAGRRALAAPMTVLCAALRVVPAIPETESAPADPGGDELVYLVGGDSAYQILYARRLIVGAPAAVLATLSQPVCDDFYGLPVRPLTNAYSFNASVTELATFCAMREHYIYPERVWTASLDTSGQQIDDWALVAEFDYFASFETSGGYTPSDNHHGGACRLFEAVYHGDELIIRRVQATVDYTITGSVSTTGDWGSDDDFTETHIKTVTEVHHLIVYENDQMAHDIVALDFDRVEYEYTLVLGWPQYPHIPGQDRIVLSKDETFRGQGEWKYIHLHRDPSPERELVYVVGETNVWPAEAFFKQRYDRVWVMKLRSGDWEYIKYLDGTWDDINYDDPGYAWTRDQTARLFVNNEEVGALVSAYHNNRVWEPRAPIKPTATSYTHPYEQEVRAKLRQLLEAACVEESARVEHYGHLLRTVKLGDHRCASLHVTTGVAKTVVDDAPVEPLDNVIVAAVQAVTPRACLLKPDPTDTRPETSDGGQPDLPSVEALLLEHNIIRAYMAPGQPALVLHQSLSLAAEMHARWLTETGNYTLIGDGTASAHYGPNGSEPLDRAIAAGYAGSIATYVGENLAIGATTIDTVMAAWMASPEHHDAIVNPDFLEFGAYIMRSPVYDGFLWAVVFGLRNG